MVRPCVDPAVDRRYVPPHAGRPGRKRVSRSLRIDISAVASRQTEGIGAAAACRAGEAVATNAATRPTVALLIVIAALATAGVLAFLVLRPEGSGTEAIA